MSQEARAERGFCDTDAMKRSLGRFAPSRAGCEIHVHDRIETNGLTVTTVVGALPHEHEIARAPLGYASTAGVRPIAMAVELRGES